MTRITFKDLPDTSTPRNAANLNKLNNIVIQNTTPTTGEEVWLNTSDNSINVLEGSNYKEFRSKIYDDKAITTDYTFNSNGTPALKNIVYGNSYQEGETSPDYPSEIENVGIINYFDKGDLEYGDLSTTTGEKIDNQTSFQHTNYIPIKNNTNLTINTLNTNTKRYFILDSNKNVITTNTFSSSNLTIQIPSNAKYLRIKIIGLFNDETTIFEGSTIPNTYVPYGNWLVQKNVGKNLFIPTLTNNGTAIIRQRSTVVLNDDEYQFTSTGEDMYFGNVGNAGTSYSNELGTLYEVKPNNNYIFSLTNNEFNSIHITQWNKDKTYVLRTNTNNSNIYKFTTNNDTKYISIRFGKRNAIVGTIYKTKCLLEQNDNATPYEPHKEEIVKLSLNKENLFDEELSTKNAWLNWQTGMVDTSSDPNVVSDYIKVKVGKTYHIIGADDLTVRIMSYNDKTSNKKTTLVDNIKKYYFVPDAEYVRIAFGSGDAISSINKFKVYEETSTPYYELNKIGDTKDEVDLVTGVLTKRIGKVVLDGSESWDDGTSNVFYGSVLPNRKFSSTLELGKSDNFKWGGNLTNLAEARTNLSNGEFGMYKTANSSVYFKNTSVDSLANWKSWLSNNNVTIYYVLAEPEIIQLDKNIVNTFKGQNNITIESNIQPEIEIEHYNETGLDYANSDLVFMYINELQRQINELKGIEPQQASVTSVMSLSLDEE